MQLQLRVVSNPYAAVDHLGRPSAVVLAIHQGPFRDNPKAKNPAQRWAARPHIGATVRSTRLTADRVIKTKGRSHTIPGKFDHAWAHSLEVVTLEVEENSQFHFHYMRAIRAHELLAADMATWLAAQGPREHFQPPEEKLAQAKEGAIAQWIATYHGEKHAAALREEGAVPLHKALSLGDDPRLDTLVTSYLGKVEQRHPVGLKLEAAHKAKLAAAEAAKPGAPTPASPAPATPVAPAAPALTPAATPATKGA